MKVRCKACCHPCFHRDMLKDGPMVSGRKKLMNEIALKLQFIKWMTKDSFVDGFGAMEKHMAKNLNVFLLKGHQGSE